MQHKIKSYVLRAGRISKRQQVALDEWLPNYLLPPPESNWDLGTLFSQTAETIVEIGFGMGASLATMAKAYPEKNFIGIEVHQAGIGSLVADLHDGDITNVRIAPYDAVTVFEHAIPDNSLAGIQIFFPDPWPKKRHHKRRLVQSEFIALIAKKLQQGGFIHCATDWEEYAYHMLTVLEDQPNLANQAGAGQFSPRPDTRPLTKFEHRGLTLGHPVHDLIYIRKT